MALRGYRGYQMADAIGMSRVAMSDRLSGKTDFRAAELIKLSYVLQVPAAQFFDNVGFGSEPESVWFPVVSTKVGARK